jgi:hypothetical protein
MLRLFTRCIGFVVLLFLGVSAGFAQSISVSSLTAISQPENLVALPIFAISRTANVVTVSTTDPGDPDQFAQQSNRIGATVTVAQVAVDPSNTANGTFAICGPPTAGCITPTTYTFSYLSNGANFSASSSSQLGLTAVARVGCPLTPTGYFSFCGDGLPGAGLASTTDTSMVEFITTQDSVGSMIWASSLGDGNSGTTRQTGCEQGFIESGNEWRMECDHMRWLGEAIDMDMANDLLTLSTGDGLNQRGTGGELVISGTRKLASFGILANHTMEIDTGAVPAGTVMPGSGILRFRNGSTNCWENVAGTSGVCQTTDAKDHFSLDNGVVTPTYNTTTSCASFAAQCGSAAAGSIGIPDNQATAFVSTTAVTAQSQIFLQEDTTLGTALGVLCNASFGRTYHITGRQPGAGFTITASAAPTGAPACLSYHIIN